MEPRDLSGAETKRSRKEARMMVLGYLHEARHRRVGHWKWLRYTGLTRTAA